MKKLNALSIGGFDTGAGAGVESDIKAFESVGVHGLGVVTAITAQNTLGIKGTLLIEPDFLKKQIETIFTDFQVSAVKTGMIVSSGQMKVISELIDRLTVVDPVIVAKDGTRLIEDLDSFKKMILPKAYVLTPNAVEAEALAGFKVVSIEDQIRAAK
ncbi:MAG: bifunctional hydroxymethylpyrimidine kinase/phosphomethylpyrimidine kinase, partial [Metallosphaera sp.]